MVNVFAKLIDIATLEARHMLNNHENLLFFNLFFFLNKFDNLNRYILVKFHLKQVNIVIQLNIILNNVNQWGLCILESICSTAE